MGKRMTIELPDASYDALRAAAASSGASPELEAVERIQRSLQDPPVLQNGSDEALMRAGLLHSIPRYDKAQAPVHRFISRAVSGKPISESIIEERR